MHRTRSMRHGTDSIAAIPTWLAVGLWATAILLQTGACVGDLDQSPGLDGGPAPDGGSDRFPGEQDSGQPVPDAGHDEDGGTADAGHDEDGGTPDAGHDEDGGTPDSGPPADAGAPDAGPPPTGEVLLFDRRGLQFTEAHNGFLPYISPGDPLFAKNWASPADYYNGEFRIRYVVEGPANQVAGVLQTCIWTMGTEDGDGRNYFPESCADGVAHNGVGTYYGTRLSPASWWKNGGVRLDFSHAERFLIRAVLRGTSGCNVTRHNVANGCWSEWPKYQAMKFRVTIVMVPAGRSFSGWSRYP